MREEAMRITLVSPRIAVQKRDFLGSGVPYWPVELAVFAAFLRERGNAVRVIDLFGASPATLEDAGDHWLQGRPFERYVRAAAVAEADLFVLYAISSMSHGDLLSIARAIRDARPGAPIAVLENSQAVTAYSIPRVAEELFRAGAGALICGEPYWNWDEIADFLRARAPAPANVLAAMSAPFGRLTCDTDEFYAAGAPAPPVRAPVRRVVVRDASYPVPAWELFPLRGYWSLPYAHGPRTARFLPILTSRGCPYPCDFCVIPETNDTRWRGRPPGEVVAEMIALRDRFGVRHFEVEDVNPTVKAARWDEVCRLLVEREARITYSFVSGTKAETVKVAEVPLYARAGCRYLSISPESGSPALVKAMGKPFDHAHALALVRACRAHGIATQACFLVGHPAERPEDHRLSCEYLRALVRAGLDEVAVFIVSPLPGSAIHAAERIDLAAPGALLSFSPKGRRDWAALARRRAELIRIFFVEKLKAGPDLWLQGWRALAGAPRTKMENLPRRILYLSWLRVLNGWRRLLSSAGPDHDPVLQRGVEPRAAPP